MSDRNTQRRSSRSYQTAHEGDLNADLPTRRRYPLPPDPKTPAQWDSDDDRGMLSRVRDWLARP